MAIFSVNNDEFIEENECFDESSDMLDSMLEACDKMLDVLGESTAAQRHFGATAKKYKSEDNDDPYSATLNKLANNKIVGRSIAKNVGKNMNNGKFDKVVSKTQAAEEKNNPFPYGDFFYKYRTDNQKEAMRYGNKAATKAAAGAALSKAAAAGVPVKKIYDKAAAKAKKKAIKETCLTILSVLDYIE